MTEEKDESNSIQLAMESFIHSEEMESDQGDTEDEEVKRNCILGISEMRDSDFSDTDIDDRGVNEEENVDEDEREENTMEVTAKLVQFVNNCEIPKPEGLVLYRPTPIAPKVLPHPRECEEHAFGSDPDENW